MCAPGGGQGACAAGGGAGGATAVRAGPKERHVTLTYQTTQVWTEHMHTHKHKLFSRAPLRGTELSAERHAPDHKKTFPRPRENTLSPVRKKVIAAPALRLPPALCGSTTLVPGVRAFTY